MSIDRRISTLEARFSSQRQQARDAGPASLDALRQKLEQMQAEWRRRDALPPEERLELLRADRKNELERRQAGLGDASSGMPPGFQACADRIFAYSEEELERMIAERVTCPRFFEWSIPGKWLGVEGTSDWDGAV